MIQTANDALTVLREFDENPVRAGRELRSAFRADCSAFLAALLNETVFAGSDRGFRFAIDLLVSNDMVIPAIATPSVTSFVQGLRLTRYMLETDGNFLNALLTALMTRQDLADPACTVRVLDLVSECATQLANWRSLIRIHSDGNDEVKSRCAALLARYRFRDEAGIERFRRSDPRIRANIIQTLWGVSQDHANVILEVAVQDEDNRVAGNACLALYNSGDTRALVHLAEMLVSPEPRKRITAAWVIGQCRDGRFASRLLEALRGDLPALRRRSITSLARLEAIPAAGASAPPDSSDDLDLCFVSAPANPAGAGYELWLHVARPGGEPAPHLRPVDFFVWSGATPPRGDDEFLFDYTAQESAQISAAAVRIVYPAGSERFERALAASLAQKPAEQSWALSSYGKASVKSAPATDTRFETDKTALTDLLENGTALSSGPMEAVNKALAPESALDEQHLVLLLDGSSLELEPVRMLCEAKKTRLHCWHLSQNSVPASVSRTEEQSAAIWPRFVASIAARYILRTSVIPAAVAVRDASVKPARFSPRTDLLKGGPNA
jgi:hypothetical protein